MVKFVMRVAFIACFIACCIAAASTPATARDTRQDQAGQFDFYLLSLSWSPSFCAAAAERAEGRPAGMQCGARPYAFIVHGLWPQYAKGFPEYCQVPAPRLDRGTVSSMLDLMPAPRLIFNEWDKHGTCSGLSPQAYFATVRKARGGENPARIYRSATAAARHAGRGGGCFHQGKFRSVASRHCR